MNYIAQINAFERWLETNYLPVPSQLLWYKLMNISNRAGWPEWIQVDNRRLMATMQINREATFIGVRDRLANAGLIEFQKGRKGFPNRYKINTFKSVVETVVQSEVKSVVNPVVKTEVETVDINKHKQKPNVNSKKGISKEIPEKKSYVPDDLLNDAILAFIDFRKKIKAPMTDHAVDLTIKKLNGMTNDNDEKIRILNQSIMNGWKGVFPLKETDQRQVRGNTGNFYDEMKEWANEHECN